jgi:hypothetical protein
VLNGFCSAGYDRLLGLLNEKTIQLLGRYNRDQAAGMLYRILLAQPRFLGFTPCIARGSKTNESKLEQLVRRYNEDAEYDAEITKSPQTPQLTLRV